MRLLITGASGFLGRNVLLALPPAWQIVAPYRPDRSPLPGFVRAHGLDHVQAVPCDLTDAALVREMAALAGSSFDACLYLASNTSIPDSLLRPVEDLTTNVVGLLNVLEHCTFEHLVYLSSGAVYVGLHGMVGPESRLAPDLPYAISKLAAEHYIRANTHQRGMPATATILRFFGAYGPYEPARKLYTRLVRRFAFERDPHFTVLGDGDNYIDAMYVDDAIRAIVAALAQRPDSDEPVRTIDLGLGQRETVNQVVRRAGRVFGLEPVVTHEWRTPEYIDFAIDPRPFATLYGVLPAIALEDGLQRLATHLRREDDHESR